jgi:hypothetical protein
MDGRSESRDFERLVIRQESNRGSGVNRKRWWLALLYVLTTVLVQGVHDHGGTDKSAVAYHGPGCADLGLHVAGHSTPDLSHAPDHGLACQSHPGNTE